MPFTLPNNLNDRIDILQRRRNKIHPGLGGKRPICNHIRPRRCCISCRNWFFSFYGEERGRRRFEEALRYWRRK